MYTKKKCLLNLTFGLFLWMDGKKGFYANWPPAISQTSRVALLYTYVFFFVIHVQKFELISAIVPAFFLFFVKDFSVKKFSTLEN